MKLGPNQQAWIAALRSGKYKQGVGQLQSPDDEYCCLGVGCRVRRPENEPFNGSMLLGPYAPIAIELGTSFDGQPHGGSVERHEALAKHVKALSPDAIENTSGYTLWKLNDSHKLTFDQIADILEEFSDLYFTESK